MLDIFFEKYTWTVNLVLLFAAAWISAKTVNVGVSALIRKKPQAITQSSAPTRPQPLARIDGEALYPLVGLPRPKMEVDRSEPVSATPKNCTDLDAQPVKSALRATLVASAISERPQWSLASILDSSARETKLYAVGDTVMGAKLLGVERVMDENGGLGDATKVVAVICNKGTKEFIDGTAEGGTSSPGSLGVQRPLPPPGGPSPVVKEGENRYSVPKSFIDSKLADLNKVSTEARLFPNYKGGNPNGFRIVQIQPNSLYSAIGLENGDVIQRINGFSMDSPDKALEIFQKLRDSTHITLEVERRGQAVRKEYNVTP